MCNSNLKLELILSQVRSSNMMQKSINNVCNFCMDGLKLAYFIKFSVDALYMHVHCNPIHVTLVKVHAYE